MIQVDSTDIPLIFLDKSLNKNLLILLKYIKLSEGQSYSLKKQTNKPFQQHLNSALKSRNHKNTKCIHDD